MPRGYDGDRFFAVYICSICVEIWAKTQADSRPKGSFIAEWRAGSCVGRKNCFFVVIIILS